MKAIVLHEYGGPEKLKFEDNVPDPQVSGDTVLMRIAYPWLVSVVISTRVIWVSSSTTRILRFLSVTSILRHTSQLHRWHIFAKAVLKSSLATTQPPQGGCWGA
jgi:hypothetical protein